MVGLCQGLEFNFLPICTCCGNLQFINNLFQVMTFVDDVILIDVTEINLGTMLDMYDETL